MSGAPDIQAVAELRQAYHRNGYRPVAVYTNQKRPIGNGWRADALQDPPLWVTRQPEADALSTGIVTGQLVGVDVDVLIQPVVDRIVWEAEQILGRTMLVRIGRAPKTLLAFRCEGDLFHKLQTELFILPDGSEAKLEILADGQQFVADGIHPDTGLPYFWPASSPETVPLDQVPTITLDQARAIIDAARAILLANGGVAKKKPKRERPPQQEQQQRPTRDRKPRDGAAGDSFFAKVNTAALGKLAAWVPNVFPEATYQTATRAYRVAPEDRGRPELQEDISFHPDGIQDFGEERGLTAIDVVIEHGGAPGAIQAAMWLCERLGIAPATLGWRTPEEIAAAAIQTTLDNSPFPITPEMVPPGGGGAGGGDPPPPEPDPEPPEDWQRARPPQGEPILLQPPVPGLPAFYPAPTEDTATAKARLDAAMLDHMNKGMRLLDLKREIDRTTEDRIAFFNERIRPDADDVEDADHQELTSAERGAFKKLVHREIAEREGFGKKLPPPPRHQFTSTPGSGKTTLAREFAAHSPGEVTWIAEPTFEKLEEEYAAYLMEPDPKPPSLLVRGRGRKDPKRPGHYMCDRKDAARAIAEAGLSVPKLLCSGCKFAQVCGDHRQRREAEALVDAGNGAVFFLADHYAFLPAPVPKPAHGILDESLLQMATDVRTIPIADLARLSVPNTDTTSADTATTLRTIIDAFTVPHPTTPERVAAGDDRIIPRALAYLRYAGINKKALNYLKKSTEKEIDRQTPRIGPHLSDTEIIDALEGGDRGPLRQLLVLISAIKTEIDIPREEATGVWLREIRIGHRTVHALGIARMRKLRGLRKAFLTILDGTGKLDLARRLFGDRLEETNIRFDRLAHVIGTKGKSYSKTSITAEDRDGNIIRGREAEAANLRGDIAKIYDRLPAGSAICATKRVEEILFDSGAVPPDAPSMHYGDLRGKNNYQHAPGLLAISAENIGIGDVEAMARAFLATDPMPFVSMDHPPTPEDSWKRWEHQWHYWATRMRRMSDGTLSPIEMPVHPNPRVQAVMELTREDELIQAVDRLRSIWNRRQLVLLNNLCLDVSYDAVYRHRHLVQGGNPIERALLATGILPHTPELLHRAHRGIFRTPKAAEHALARNSPQFPGGTLFWDLGVVRFRRAGQHGPEAKATVDRTRWPDNAALIAAIETFAGPLQSFQGVALRRGATPADAPTMQPGAGWVPPTPRQPGSGAAPPSIMVHGPPDG